MFFYVWLLSLNIVFSRFTHVVECISTSFLWLNNILFNGYTTFCLSIHQLMDSWVVSAFWLLWVMLLWTFFIQGFVFSSLGYLCRGRIDGSHGNSTFNFLRNHQSVFSSVCTILHSHQQCMMNANFYSGLQYA